jgi:hypothetical protein
MLKLYVLTCGRSVTAFLAPPRSQRPGQGPRLPHPKASPASIKGRSSAFIFVTASYELRVLSLSLSLSLSLMETSPF